MLRHLTFSAACLGSFLATATDAQAQLLKRFRSNDSGCANGSCGIPQQFTPQGYAPQAYTLPQPYNGATAGVEHTHTCPRCGTTWGGVGHSHNCPRCGTAQYVQDNPPRAPTFNPSAPPLYLPQAPESPRAALPAPIRRETVSYCGCGDKCPCAAVSSQKGVTLVTFVP